jgi:hypothetical protein
MFESFASFFTTVQVVLISAGAAFVAGVVFSQRVKDWIKGVPTDLRKALKGVEGDVLDRVRAAQAEVVATLLQKTAQPADKVALPPDPQKPALVPAPAPLPPAPAPAPLPSEAPPVTPAIT